MHIGVKPGCARDSVEGLEFQVHDLHMAVSAKKKPAKKPDVHTPTFMRAWREAVPLTLEAMADQLGYEDHTTLSKVERGLVPYGQEVLEGYARVLGCTVVDLLTRPPGEAEELLSIWSRLDSRGRNIVVGAAKAALE